MADDKDQITNYRQGKLSPAEMHALEKRALSDPFLREALEGSEELDASEFAGDVRALNQKVKKQSGVSWGIPLRIAAGLLLAGAAITWWSYQNTPEPLALQKTSVDTMAAASKKSVVTDSIGPTDTVHAQQLLSLNTTKPDSRPRATQKPTSETEEQPTAGPIVYTEETKPTETEKAIASEDLADLPKLASAQPEETKRDISLQDAARKEAAASGSSLQADLPAIRGQVKDESGTPLPGVNVQVKGTSIVTVTDSQGFYSVVAPDPNASLVFSFIGLQTTEKTVREKKSLDVVLAEDMSQLSEVVVTGQRTIPLDDDKGPVIRLAEPFGGRKAYDKYLEKNLRYPAEALAKKIKGRVLLEFTVGIDGSLADFNVIRSLGYGCDEEVIRLVKEGPKWFPTTEDDVPVESNVRVRMKFDPAKAGQ